MCTRSVRLALSTLGVAVLVSCSSTSEGSPKPESTSDTNTEPVPTAPSSSRPSSDDLPYGGAPKVENSLDTTEFEQDPCRVLTATQAQELNVGAAGEERDAALGMECRYPSNSDVGAYVAISFATEFPYGLSAVYAANNDGNFAFFEELDPIEGYPAVSWGADDIRNEGYCSVAVGVADNLTFDTTVQLSQANVGQKDPCETAAMVAGMALQTMKGAQ